MPIHSFECKSGHVNEKLFLTFAAAEGVNKIPCPNCGKQAERVEFETPYPAHLYGNPEGYHKPSPTKRHSWKQVSEKWGNRGMYSPDKSA